jgi:hypothetical protein
MSQDYESIGQLSPEAEALVTNPPEWPGEIPESLGDQITDHNISELRQRGNTQTLGLNIDNMAGYEEPPMAAITVTPW